MSDDAHADSVLAQLRAAADEGELPAEIAERRDDLDGGDEE